MATGNKAEQVVLEEILTAAVKIGRQAAKKFKANGSQFEAGRVFACYDLITVAQEQAKLLRVQFADKSLDAFDADKELLLPQPKPDTA